MWRHDIVELPTLLGCALRSARNDNVSGFGNRALFAFAFAELIAFAELQLPG